jgi:hypothetical protein
VGLTVGTTASNALADVTWDVDPALSSITLTIPDQTVNVPGVGNVTARIRNADNSAWSQGRTAALDGTLSTDFVDGSSIDFLGGAHNVFALETGSFRPNPAVWNGTTWTDTSGAPAAFAGKVRGTLVITVDVGFMALRSVFADIESNVVPLGGGGSFAASSTMFGLESAQLQLDGFTVLGNDVPDLNEPLDAFLAGNTAGAGSVISPDPIGQPLLRKLTLPVNVPLAIPIEDVGAVNGSITGTVVAFAVVPEPSALALAVIGMAGLIASSWRRRHVA